MFNPLTTAAPIGVALRYISTIISSVLAIVSIIGWLTPEQVASLSLKVQQISGHVPELVTAISGLVALLVPVYAMLTKSSSDRAAEAARQIDRNISAENAVVIATPPGVADIVVSARRR